MEKKIDLTNRNVTIITLARAAIQTNAVRLNTIIASRVILNKTSRRNTVFFFFFFKEKNSYCEKEFDTARARSKSGFRVMLMLKYKLKEFALVNVNRTDVLSKSIHLGVN